MTFEAPRGILRLDAADLVVTAGAASTLAELDEALAPHGAWLALDPPGPRTRSLGACLGTGAAGPLAALYGPPRDQVIGLTFVAGDGTAVHTGGRVVKNVAGFDLAKVVIGGHGAFGLITEAHLRLRAQPAADRTRGWVGSLDAMADATARLMHAGATLAACEVLSPDLAVTMAREPRWTLLARAHGTAEGVDEELEAADAAVGQVLTAVPVQREVWVVWSDAVGAWPAAVRIGADPARWRDAAAMALRHGASGVSATVPRGTVRARFAPRAAEAILRLRLEATDHGWPVTVERAEDETLRAVGIWGAIPGGTLQLARSLRETLGPKGTESIPLWV